MQRNFFKKQRNHQTTFACPMLFLAIFATFSKIVSIILQVSSKGTHNFRCGHVPAHPRLLMYPPPSRKQCNINVEHGLINRTCGKLSNLGSSLPPIVSRSSQSCCSHLYKHVGCILGSVYFIFRNVDTRYTWEEPRKAWVSIKVWTVRTRRTTLFLFNVKPYLLLHV